MSKRFKFDQQCTPAVPFWDRPAILHLLLIVSTLVVYAAVIRCGFLNFDDDVYVTENRWVMRPFSWASVAWAFTTLEAGFWQPLNWLSYILDYQLYGLNAGGFHLTNLLLHAANTGLLFHLLSRLTRQGTRSAMVAALFALHPLHVESVAWIAERKDVLSTFFGLLTLIFYVRYAASQTPNTRGQWRYYLAAIVFFAFGLMSKPMLVTWPFLLLLLDVWPLSRFQGGAYSLRGAWRLVAEKIPFLLLALVAGLLTIRAERIANALAELPAPLSHRVANAIVNAGHYLVQTIWPVNLAVFYPYQKSHSGLVVAAAATLLVALTCLVFLNLRRRPWLTVGWLWYAISLVPVSGLIQVGSHAHADRYTYIPLIGIFLMVVWEAAGFLERYLRWPGLGAGLAVLLLGACGWRAADQISYWQDSGTLFRRAIAVARDNDLAQVNLGFYYFRQQQTAAAVACFQRALDLNPANSAAWLNLGACHAEQNDYAAARRDYEAALRLEPDRIEAVIGLGNVLLKAGERDAGVARLQAAIRHAPDSPPAHNSLGLALASGGQFSEAIREYEAALNLAPDLADTHYNLGVALAAQGEMKRAVQSYEMALRFNPGLIEVHNSLGGALVSLGRLDEAIQQFKELLQLSPHYPNAHANMGIALAMKGSLDAAVLEFRAALHDNPNDADAFFNFGNVLVRQRRFDFAVRAFEDAVRLRPKYAEAHANLGCALAELGRLDEAVVHLRESLRLQPELSPPRQKLIELGREEGKSL